MPAKNLVKTTQKLDNNKNSVTVNKYNAIGLLEKVVLGDGTANGEKNITKYKYNVVGLRIEKVVNGQRINHVCYYYPTITDGGSFKIYEPNNE